MVLSPHLSAFLIAAIKVPPLPLLPPPHFPPSSQMPENPVCATVYPGCAWSSGGFRGASIRLFLQKIQQPEEQPEERALSGHLRFTNKKEDRFSLEKARVLICRPSCHSPAVRGRSCLPVASLISQSLFGIDSVLCLPLYFFFFLSYYVCNDNCANSLRTYN